MVNAARRHPGTELSPPTLRAQLGTEPTVGVLELLDFAGFFQGAGGTITIGHSRHVANFGRSSSSIVAIP
jgi:hypothetical protein